MKKRLLIVDDNREILTQLRWALQDDFDLLLAAGLDEAEALLGATGAPEAALVDLHLPPDTSSIDGGLSLIRALKELDETTRVIAFSAHAGEEADSKTRSAGAEILLNKPVQRDRLLEILKP